MKKIIASLLLIAGLTTSAQAQVDAKCSTTEKFITEFKTGLMAPISTTKYSLENTIKILLVFYKDFGVDISMIDPKKLEGSIFITSDKFPNAVVMILTADKEDRVMCYNAVISMKIYKYAVDKLGLTEI